MYKLTRSGCLVTVYIIMDSPIFCGRSVRPAGEGIDTKMKGPRRAPRSVFLRDIVRDAKRMML